MKMGREIWNPIELMQLHDGAQLIRWSLILLTLDDRVMPKFEINEKISLFNQYQNIYRNDKMLPKTLTFVSFH